MDGSDFLPGDPARHVLGRPDEKPARRHGTQKPRPVTARTILTDIKFRLHKLRDAKEEHDLLTAALEAIKDI